ncbi:stress response protein NST1-like [Plectropomus leopardus]|uniref:stress response protein NST1-like n=1 Tax=Plectropomus leopardus TaxID=160734 RepID=UPI001C4B6EEA|nr:stress response protein NST1-like [Plectropomus leopardus]
MPRKRDIVKSGAPINRIRENTRLMRTHETMVDFINGRHPGTSFLDVFSSGLFGLDFLRNLEGELEDDIIYSDEDDDDDRFYSRRAAHKKLEPHPRIKQLTEEEADRHAKELIEEEERRKEKTEKNKRKKMRKKEKKRLEKENAVKVVLPEEENGKSDSSENQEEQHTVIESDAEDKKSPESGKTQNGTEASGCNESGGNQKEENVAEMIKKDVEQKVLDLNNSCPSTTQSVPEETCNQKPVREKSKLLEVQPFKEEKPEVVEKPEVQKMEEEKHEPNNEVRTLDLNKNYFPCFQQYSNCSTISVENQNIKARMLSPFLYTHNSHQRN